VSARASAYAKSLIVCPNGELISKGEKLVLIVLADSHQDKAKRFTYPSIDSIAPEAMCDRRSCQRYMASLERKGVIRRLRPASQGRGMAVFYFFTQLDEIPEGWQNAALFDGHYQAQKGGKRAAEGRQKGGNLFAVSIERAQERKPELKQEQRQTPPNPLGREGDVVDAEMGDAATAKGNADGVERDAVPLRANEPAQDCARPGVGLATCSHVWSADRGVDSRRSERRGGRWPRPETADGGVEGNGRAAQIARRAAHERSLDAAAAQVCNGLNLSEPRDRRRVRRAIALQAEKGDEPPTIALGMMAAFGRQSAARLRGELSASYGAVKFVCQGVWKDQGRWHWNEEVLRQRAQASVGSR
jgi:hypothetical protein